jgi:hypothetical protein
MNLLRFSTRSFVLAAAMVVVAATVGRGQSSVPAGPVDLSSVRKDLKALVAAQETYFSNHNAYATAMSALEFVPAEGVTIKLLEVAQGSYSASGILAGKSGASCVMFINRVSAIPKTAQGLAAKEEGVPVCDGDPPAEPARTSLHGIRR